MFLVKNRDFYIQDENIFQLDISFNSEDDNCYTKGYYLIASEVNLIKKSKTEIHVQKMYSKRRMIKLKESNEECSEILSQCLEEKENFLTQASAKCDVFFKENVILKDDCTANYSVNAIIKNPDETLKIINSLRDKAAVEASKQSKNTNAKKKENIEAKKQKAINEIIKKEGNSNSSVSSDDDNSNSYFKPVNVTNFTFDSVAGLHEVKEELKQVVDYVKHSEKYKAMGAQMQKGILFYGPPGTGKTLLAKALAGETNSKFFEVNGCEFVEKYVGVGAKRVRELFEVARREAPSIIFIDEIDAIGATRNPEREGEHNKTLNQLLVEMDGFEENDNVLVIAATNRLDILDSALTRAGRLGEHLYIGNPDYETRKEMFKIHTSNKPLNIDVNLDSFARRTHGFNGADIKNICNNAALFAIRDDADDIKPTHFEKAFDKVIVGLHSKTKKMIEEERTIVAYHEAGHAFFNSKLSSETVEKVSILPTGKALGFVYHLPTEDRYLSSRKQLEDRIQILLAGRAAEEIFIGDVTNGSSDDLKKASSIALRMVREYAMDKSSNSLLVSDTAKISEDDKKKATAILNECYDKCKKLIKNNQETIRAIAQRLLDVEEINGEELNEIISNNESKLKFIDFM